MENEKMISERKAASLLKIHASTLMHWRKAGLIPVNYEEKKYITGKIRINYNEAQFRNWIRLSINSD
ncbi:MAG: hypothetical protein PHQ22_08920 [Sulfuricurvum sp.]|nr:hypothetical protein [Sulfuricurvum sp.]